MADFQRPREGFRFKFGGMKLGVPADALPQGKYAMAVNVRAYDEDTVQTRPGLTKLFQTGATNKWVTDFRAYSAIQTDNLPRILTRNADDTIWLDTGVQVGTLAGSGGTPGATMIPFRPNQSPNPYMYVANGNDYQKFSSPLANVVTQQKVGIAEPQMAPDAGIGAMQLSPIGSPVVNPTLAFNAAGTASAVGAATRVTNTVAGVFNDPANSLLTTLQFNASAGSGQVITINITNGGQYNPANGPPSVTLTGGGFSSQAFAQVTSMGSPGGSPPPYIFVSQITITSPGAGYTSNPTVVFGNVPGQITPAVANAFIGSPGSTISTYQRGMLVAVGANNLIALVQDVFPAIPGPLTISAIQYFTGTTGRCIVVPKNLGAEGSTDNPSIYNEILVNNLRRGALIKIGTEVCLVLSVTTGPDGSISIETSTTATHTTADTIVGVPAIQIVGTSQVGDTVTAADYTASIGSGIGTLTSASLPNNLLLSGAAAFQADDYFHVSINVDNLANLTEIRILLDVGDGTFTKNFYYLSIRPSDISAAVLNSATQLAGAQNALQRQLIEDELTAVGLKDVDISLQSVTGSSQWSELTFPLTQFTRVGNDQTVNLQNVNKVQILFNASGSLAVAWNSICVFGGYQPDVGDIGAPYLYRVRPRSKVTGVIGNPSPATRYGVTARRQQVNVNLPSPAYDGQIDTWDVFRYGGSVTSWRFIGSTPSTNTTFADNFGDDAAGEGDELEFDNFEPWPVVDVPNNGIASVVAGTVAIISTTDTDTAQYLPGTLVQIGSINVYTLRLRPVNIGGSTYRLEFEENAGAQTNVAYNIQEPLIANGKLPYMWGPDANGVVFACGDSFNPGKLYYAKNYAPDSAPDKYNQEVTPPSEPLAGGEVMDGVPFVASSERWWRLYFQPENEAQRYNPVQEPVQRGLAAPLGRCTDGKDIYFWAKDGIYGVVAGSLTDADLYHLFPHEGVPADDQEYNGVIVRAPDYSRVKTFRLTHSNGYLYAIYQDFSGTYRVLTLDLRRMAWCADDYSVAGNVTAAYHVEQQSSSGGTLNPVTLFAKMLPASTQSEVCVQTLRHNDDTTPISCVLSTNEWDGGDLRAPAQWGDVFLDLVPQASASPGGKVVVMPVSLGAQVAPTTAIPSGFNRIRVPISVGGVVVSDFMGLFLTWADDYSIQSDVTRLIAWQPSFDLQPSRIIGLSTFGSSYGLQGYGHIRQIAVAWTSTQPITLTLTTFDGEDPAPIVIPSSGGAYQKQLFPVGANKGQLFSYKLSSPASFQIFEDDCEVHVGAWSRSDGYKVFKGLGGIAIAESPI